MVLITPQILSDDFGSIGGHIFVLEFLLVAIEPFNKYLFEPNHTGQDGAASWKPSCLIPLSSQVGHQRFEFNSIT